jgi:hypothetical protein
MARDKIRRDEKSRKEKRKEEMRREVISERDQCKERLKDRRHQFIKWNTISMFCNCALMTAIPRINRSAVPYSTVPCRIWTR